jgi:hypothetical protein
MFKPPANSWCDDEFVVRCKSRGEPFTHVIQVLNGGTCIFDYVIDSAGMPLASVVKTSENRWKTELSEDGIPVFTQTPEDDPSITKTMKKPILKPPAAHRR